MDYTEEEILESITYGVWNNGLFNNIGLNNLHDLVFKKIKPNTLKPKLLTIEQMNEYNRVFKLIRPGYVYTIGNNGDEYVIHTNSIGCKEYIKLCISSEFPPEIILKEIFIMDANKGMIAELCNIRWIGVIVTNSNKE